MNTDYKEQLKNLRERLLTLKPDENLINENYNKLLELLKNGEDYFKTLPLREEIQEENEKIFDSWDNSLYMRALDLLDNVSSQFIKKTADGIQLAFITVDPAGNILDQDESEQMQPRYIEDSKAGLQYNETTKFNPTAEEITVKEQAVINYFLSNPGEDPTEQGAMTMQQITNILQSFDDLDGYYYEASNHNENIIDIAEEFIKFMNGGKLSYRTRAKAQEAGAITDIPQMLAVPTQKEFLNSISFYNKGAAYLQQVKPSIPLKFENGFLSLDGISGNPFKAKLEDITTQENIEEIDLPILSIFYTIILHQFQASNYTELKDTVKISIPDLAEYMGLPRNLNKERTTELIEKVKSYHNIIGVIPSLRRTRSKTPPLPDLSPVLLLVNYFEDTNIIEFSSPYMNRIINTIFEESIRRNKQGEIERKNNGEPLLRASHSYLIKGSLAKARDQIAAENVKIIIQGIERAGKNNYKIAVKTLIDRNTQLKKRLESDPINKGRLLKQVFKNTWRLLQEETILTERYNNIILPDPNDPANIPTVKDIESKVFVITHDGKKK